jgi:2-keto-4-pentenoate hydratase/2-oxohepta-3-ene-1,7-dioic acid hydratase in catechol pathway
VRVAVFGADERLGAVVGDAIVDLNLARRALLEARRAPNAESDALAQVPPRLDAFMRLGQTGLDAAAEAIASIDPADVSRTIDERVVVTPLVAATLHPPLTATSRLFMAMGNYPDHISNIWKRRDGRSVGSPHEVSAEIRAQGRAHFVKHRATVIPTGADVRYPSRTSCLDFEAEVAVILGSSFVDLAEQELQGLVWGVTLVNDWSIRDYANRSRDFAYTKNFDTSCTVGPWITVGEVEDVQSVPFGASVNGTTRQRGTTADMAFSFAELASYLSTDMTLLAGDLISAGTCAGTGADILDEELAALPGQRRFLDVGDEVEVSAPSIGAIRNRIAPSAKR